jgi:hypothetical protein
VSEPEGTVRWFGPNWRSPANDLSAEIPAPVGETCECNRLIEEGQQGIRIPHLGGDHEWTYYHLYCFLENVLPGELLLETLQKNPRVQGPPL